MWRREEQGGERMGRKVDVRRRVDAGVGKGSGRRKNRKKSR